MSIAGTASAHFRLSGAFEVGIRSGLMKGRGKLSPYSQRLARDSVSVRLDSIQAMAQVTDVYRYELVPAMLVGLESIVGERAMRSFLAKLVRRKDVAWDYGVFRAAALESGIAADAWTLFEHRCITPRDTSACIH